MMNPTTDLFEMGMTYLLPLLICMLGAWLLGVALGVSRARSAKSAPAVQKSEPFAAEVPASASMIAGRPSAAEEAAILRQRELENELVGARAELQSLKLALAAARRPVQAVHNAAAVRDAEKLAHLEKQAARVPELLRALEEIKAEMPAAVKRPKANAAGAQPLPEQVYRLMSDSFGKRIERDDLQLVEGIGPKIAEHLVHHGFKTWKDVAAARPQQLKKVLDEAGDRFHLHDPKNWPEQCRMMVENRWEELLKYQRKLSRARA